MKNPTSVRTRRLISLTVATVAAIVLVLSTLANASNAWDPVNFLVRVAAGTVAVAAGAEWVILSLGRAYQDEDADLEARAPTSRALPSRALPSHVLPSRVQPEAVPRSAGSGTVIDRLVSLFGHRRTAAQDLAVVSAGGAVLVVAYLMERKVRRVWLRVGLDEASAEALGTVLGAAPHRVFGTQAPTRGRFRRSAFTQVDGASGSGAWSVSVPTVDVDLLRHVLVRAQETR